MTITSREFSYDGTYDGIPCFNKQFHYVHLSFMKQICLESFLST